MYVIAFYSKFIEQDTFLHTAVLGQTMCEIGQMVVSFLPKLKSPPWLLLFNDEQIEEIFSSMPEQTIKRLSFYEYDLPSRELKNRFVLFTNDNGETEKAFLEEN